jgi:hypothetical protein
MSICGAAADSGRRSRRRKRPQPEIATEGVELAGRARLEHPRRAGYVDGIRVKVDLDLALFRLDPPGEVRRRQLHVAAYPHDMAGELEVGLVGAHTDDLLECRAEEHRANSVQPHRAALAEEVHRIRVDPTADQPIPHQGVSDPVEDLVGFALAERSGGVRRAGEEGEAACDGEPDLGDPAQPSCWPGFWRGERASAPACPPGRLSRMRGALSNGAGQAG